MEKQEPNLNLLFSDSEELKQVLEFKPEAIERTIREKLQVFLKNYAQKKGVPEGNVTQYFEGQKKNKTPGVNAEPIKASTFEKLVSTLLKTALQKKAEQEKSEQEKFLKKQKAERLTAKNKAVAGFLNDGLGDTNNRNIMRFIQDTDANNTNDSNPYNKIAANLIDVMVQDYFSKANVELTENERRTLSSSYMDKLKSKKREMDESFRLQFKQKDIENELNSAFEEKKEALVHMTLPERRITIRRMVTEVLLRGDNGFNIENINDYRPSAANMQLKGVDSSIHNSKNLNIVDFFTEYYYSQVTEKQAVEDMADENPYAKKGNAKASILDSFLQPTKITELLTSFFTIAYAMGISQQTMEQASTGTVNTTTIKLEDAKVKQLNDFLTNNEKLYRTLRQKPAETLTDIEKQMLETYNSLKFVSEGLANQEALASGNQTFVPRPNH